MVAPLIAAALIGAGAGAAKSEFSDKPREARQRKLAAETIRWSPWTHMQAQPIQEADLLGSTVQGGLTGLSMGQNMGLSGQEAAAPVVGRGTMDGAEPYYGPPAQWQGPPAPPKTGSGYSPWGAPMGNPQAPNYSDWLYMNAATGKR